MAQKSLVNIDLMYKVGKLSIPKPINWVKAVDPIVKELKQRTKDRKTRTEGFINDMPAGVNISKLDEKMRPMVTEYLSANKAAYVAAAKITSKYDATDQRYVNAVETMNQIRGGFEALSSDLEILAQHRKSALDNSEKISPYANDNESSDHYLFSSGDVYDNTFIRGGRLYYTGADGTERGMDDFKIATQSSTGLATNINTTQKSYRNRAEQGKRWDEKSALREVELVLKDAGSKKIGDLMYTYYIDDYIEQNYGLDPNCVGRDCDFEPGFSGLTKDLDPEAHTAIYDQLKNEDLTDEFKDHFLGMLKQTHIDMYTPKTADPTGLASEGKKKQYGVKYLTNIQVRNEVDAIINAPDDNFQIVRNDNLGKYYKTGGQWYYFDGENTAPVTVNDVIRGQQYYGFEIEEERDPNLNPLTEEVEGDPTPKPEKSKAQKLWEKAGGEGDAPSWFIKQANK